MIDPGFRPKLVTWLLHGAWIGSVLGALSSLWLTIPGALNPAFAEGTDRGVAALSMFLIAGLIAGTSGLGLGSLVALITWAVAWVAVPANVGAATRLTTTAVTAMALPLLLVMCVAALWPGTLANSPIWLFVLPVSAAAIVGALVALMFSRLHLAKHT